MLGIHEPTSVNGGTISRSSGTVRLTINKDHMHDLLSQTAIKCDIQTIPCREEGRSWSCHCPRSSSYCGLLIIPNHQHLPQLAQEELACYSLSNPLSPIMYYLVTHSRNSDRGWKLSDYASLPIIQLHHLHTRSAWETTSKIYQLHCAIIDLKASLSLPLPKDT